MKAVCDLSELLMKWFQEDDERMSRVEALCRKGRKLEERRWREGLLDVLDDIFAAIRKNQGDSHLSWSRSLAGLRKRFLS